MLLGVDSNVELRQAEVALESGDRLVFVTDGVIEAFNGDGAMYGTERLESLLADRRDATAKALVAAVVADVKAFAGGAAPHDDTTVLALRVK
jgi:sigma-B regulation protein RsbU (phosphoserine phosphatase)